MAISEDQSSASTAKRSRTTRTAAAPTRPETVKKSPTLPELRRSGIFGRGTCGWGGQGAPLAPFFHFALANYLGETSPLAFLNLGGIANVSWVDPGAAEPEAPGALLAFDTGPANSLLDLLMQSRVGRPCDIGGAVSSAGKENDELLDELMRAPYFSAKAPKSLDRSHFLHALAGLDQLSLEDAAATLAEFTARSVAEGFKQLPTLPSKTVVSGGGVYNRDLMKRLARALPTELVGAGAIGLIPHAIEAQAFGYLAVRAMRGLPITCPSTTGCAEPAVGAKVSQPRSPLPGL